jgi:Spy/CpxP family protein refolding chaperone
MNFISRSILLPLLTLIIAAPAMAESRFSSTDKNHHRHDRDPMAKGIAGKKMQLLNLTPAQQAKATEIAKTTRDRIQAVMTVEQKQRFKSAIAADRDPYEAMSEMKLSLTAAQKAKIKAIKQDSRQQFKALLTPEQMKQMKVSHAGNKIK